MHIGTKMTHSASKPMRPPSSENRNIMTKMMRCSFPSRALMSLLMTMSIVFVSLIIAKEPPAIMTKKMSDAMLTSPVGIALKN